MATDVDTLIEQCLRGDARAWRALVDAYAPLVYAVARRSGLRDDACDDVAQAVFSALHRRLGALRAGAALVSWLSTTARREAWRMARAARSHAGAGVGAGTPGDVPDDAAANSAPDADLERLETHRRLRAALDELGGRCAELLRLLYVATPAPGYKEVGEALGMPVGAIGPTRQRCLAKLAALLEPSAPGTPGERT